MTTLFDDILPAQTLGIAVSSWSNGRIELTAPLSKNQNDKGTAFAGSIDSMLDLAGWSAITLALRDAGAAADVMIVKSSTKYGSAVRADMTASTEISGDQIDRLVEDLKAHGKRRITLQCRLSADQAECATMQAQYAVIAPADPVAEATQ